MTKRGRPPTKGRKRHECGKLVQRAEPNEVVVNQRLALLGGCGADLSQADDPMTLAFARGWISRDCLMAGDRYAKDYQLCHSRSSVPRLTASLEESPERADRDLRSLGEMKWWEIADAFNALDEKTRDEAASDARRIAARERWNRVTVTLTALEQNELFKAFCLREWPTWMTLRLMGRPLTPDAMRRQLALMNGLEVVRTALRRARAHAA